MAMFGDGIYYVPTGSQVWFYSFVDKQPRHVFDLNKELASVFATSPDRKWLLFAPAEHVRAICISSRISTDRSGWRMLPAIPSRRYLARMKAVGSSTPFYFSWSHSVGGCGTVRRAASKRSED